MPKDVKDLQGFLKWIDDARKKIKPANPKRERADHWTWKPHHLDFDKPKKDKLDEKAMGHYWEPKREKTQLYATDRKKHHVAAERHAKTFTEDHERAVENYKAESSYMNRRLRYGDALENNYKDRVHYLDHVTSGKTDHHIVAWRSVSRDLELDLKPGTTFKDKGFTGLTFKRNTAEEFARLRRHDDDYDDEECEYDCDENDKGKPVIARIHVPKGSRGHYIDHTVYTTHKHEKEFLLHRGTTFKVHGHTENDEVHIVHLSVHEQEEHIPPQKYRGKALPVNHDPRQGTLPLQGGDYYHNLKNPGPPKRERPRYPSNENLPVNVKQRWKPKLKGKPGDSYIGSDGEVYKKMNFDYFKKKDKEMKEEIINEVDKATLETQYRNWGFWDGKSDKEVGAFPGKSRFSKGYVYRALPVFQSAYWDGYWAGYYERSFDPLKEDAPINNVGSGEIAAVGISPPNKPTMWGEPGKDNKKRFRAMLMQMLGRKIPRNGRVY